MFIYTVFGCQRFKKRLYCLSIKPLYAIITTIGYGYVYLRAILGALLTVGQLG